MNISIKHIFERAGRAVFLLSTLSVAVLFASCRKEVGPTYVHVGDSVRHYLPIIQGDELRMLWKVYNDGPNPLIISDVQPACSAIRLTTEMPTLIPVGDSAVMIFAFNTAENINYTEHTIRVFGNIEPTGEAEMHFDVTIVPPSMLQVDFEERLLRKLTEEDVASGKTRKNLYYTDRDPFENYE